MGMSVTDDKIMDAALKLFAENGYSGARTRIIAEKAGLSEMTLFRKFKTKENLFNRVLIKNQEIIWNDFNTLIANFEVKDHKEDLRILFENLLVIMHNNFELVTILINERTRITNFKEFNLEKITSYLGQYLKEQRIFKDMDFQIFALNILSFMFFLILDKKGGIGFINNEKAIDEYLNNFISPLYL